jgi:hypothetical protein
MFGVKFSSSTGSSNWPPELAASTVSPPNSCDPSNANPKLQHYLGRIPCRKRVQNFGKPLAPSTRVNYLTALRTFFRDLHEWEIVPRRFDPIRTFAIPNSFAQISSAMIRGGPGRPQLDRG